MLGIGSCFDFLVGDRVFEMFGLQPQLFGCFDMVEVCENQLVKVLYCFLAAYGVE